MFSKKVALLGSVFLFSISFSQAASTSAQATLRIVQSLSIATTSMLNFGVVTGNHSGVTVNPKDSNAAEFSVQGEPEYLVSIKLPENGEVKMVNVSGGKQISVSNFLSSPSAKTPAKLNQQGKMILKVGASTSAIDQTYSEGLYVGTFNVTVIY